MVVVKYPKESPLVVTTTTLDRLLSEKREDRRNGLERSACSPSGAMAMD